MTAADRFWAKVDRRGPDECWPWKGSRGPHGHGHFWDGTRVVKAYRFSWELENGPIPKGEGYHGTCACHRCDNPPCVNPAHLFLGAHADNMADAGTKGRMSRGETRPLYRLTEADVVAIIARRDAGESMRALAREYGVHHSTISQIGVRSWTWVRGATRKVGH